jgi:hypothetical protein
MKYANYLLLKEGLEVAGYDGDSEFFHLESYPADLSGDDLDDAEVVVIAGPGTMAVAVAHAVGYAGAEPFDMDFAVKAAGDDKYYFE